MERRLLLPALLVSTVISLSPLHAYAQTDDVVFGIEQVEVREVLGNTIMLIVADEHIGNEINYPCAETDIDKVLVAPMTGLNPGSSWKMVHATALAALSRGANVRVRMGDCIEYMPGQMAREIIGVTMFR